MAHRSLARPAGPVVSALALSAALVLAAAVPASAESASSQGWRITKTFAADTDLDALVPIPGGTAWAGGETPGQLPAVYHLASGRWRATILPGSQGTFVNQISATSATNVWASLSNTPAVERLTGRGWVAHTFAIGTDQILLDGVVSFSRKDADVFAYDVTTKLSYAYHYNGTKWIRRPLPSGIDANSNSGLVSATSPSNIWGLTIVGSDTYASLRYNGTKWQVIRFPRHLAPSGKTPFARQILAESPTNVWASIFVNSAKGVGPVVLLHWNGSRWTKVGGKIPPAALSGPMASDGHGGLWLAASNTAFTKALLLHYTHGKWRVYTAPTDAKQQLTVMALALVPGTESLIGTAIVGETFGGDSGAAILRYGR